MSNLTGAVIICPPQVKSQPLLGVTLGLLSVAGRLARAEGLNRKRCRRPLALYVSQLGQAERIADLLVQFQPDTVRLCQEDLHDLRIKLNSGIAGDLRAGR